MQNYYLIPISDFQELYKVSKEVSNFPSLVTSKSSTSEESAKEKQMQKEETESNKSESKNGQMSSDKTLKRKQTGENKTEQEAPVSKVQKLNEANNTASNKVCVQLFKAVKSLVYERIRHEKHFLLNIRNINFHKFRQIL